ncbi:hypothetical protein PtB15_7B495 [Puccinia triticina]|nr:hypothetical protein PtB15_7B495 [Puccinia triticina]
MSDISLLNSDLFILSASAAPEKLLEPVRFVAITLYHLNVAASFTFSAADVALITIL